MMKKRMFSSLMAVATLPLMAMNVSAAEFSQLEADKSKVAFQYEQMGVKLDGQFKAFSADLSFDPAKPESAKASLDVDLASVDTGSPDADTEVVTKPWFNVPAFPKARFVASSIKPAGGDNYQITGKLSIKGTDKEVSFPATFKANGEQGVFKGSLPIKRGDFAIGEGDWSSFDIVANDVIVNFELAVKAAQ